MPIIRINEFKAKDEKVSDLREFLLCILPLVKSSQGCVSCELLARQDSPSNFVVMEAWESTDAHQNSAKNIPVDELKKVMALLAEPPKGYYFTKVGA